MKNLLLNLLYAFIMCLVAPVILIGTVVTFQFLVVAALQGQILTTIYWCITLAMSLVIIKVWQDFALKLIEDIKNG